MQLDGPARAPSLRRRLGAAACVLLASGASARAHADPAVAPVWQFDGTALLYGEKGRADVVEPMARITRLLPGGQTLSAQLGIDVITGASPTGAMPSGAVQTTTTPSGNVTTSSAGQIPEHRFKDTRGVLDLEWTAPFARRFTSTVGTHFSREKDYQSLGADGKLSVELLQRLVTVTVGGGYNRDRVFPVGGTPVPLSDGSTLLGFGPNPKRVATGLVGISRVLTRRWLVGVDASRMQERGYLTEPYKVVSLLEADTGSPVGELTDKRPGTRRRTDVLASSVYHLATDVFYSSYRYYWDDWGVRSHTLDLKYRRELQRESYLQPHVRLYTQTPADFFRFGLIRGSPLPEFATSDYRLGPLHSATLGATYGFRIPRRPGEVTVRAEYMRQWGDGHPRGAVGAQRGLDLFPPLNVASLVVGYSVGF
jgi:hypothetical protein